MFVPALAALLPLLPAAVAEKYPLAESLKGQNFLDGWTYPVATYDNTTNGDVFWATPQNTSLIYTNDAGRVIVKVDNESFVPYDQKRYAPKLFTKKAYPTGTVWVMDAVHLPYGCSVWPALWTQGANWPDDGEIDIFEGINNQKTNQIALHTDHPGCYASSDVTMLGSLGSTNCSIKAGGAGCVTRSKDEASYGSEFAAAGGGIYVTEFADEFIKVWFLTRSKIPSGVTADADSIDTSTLGEPTAWYPRSTCDISKFFGDQTLTLTITLCGDWAGTKASIEQTCGALTGNQTCYNKYVMNDQKENLKNAYFEINYINIYSNATKDEITAGSHDVNENATSSGRASGSGDSTTTAGTPEPTKSNKSGRNIAAWSTAAVGIVGAGLALAL